jgi:hypothetical protein
LLTALVAAILTAPAAFAQEPPLATFVIIADTNLNDVTLTCQRGCDWRTLRFPLTATPTWVDQVGLLGDEGDKVPGDGAFLLGVYATKGAADDGLDLRCKWGCRYQSFAFTPRKIRWVIVPCGVTPIRFWKPEDAELPCSDRERPVRSQRQ